MRIWTGRNEGIRGSIATHGIRCFTLEGHYPWHHRIHLWDMKMRRMRKFLWVKSTSSISYRQRHCSKVNVDLGHDPFRIRWFQPVCGLHDSALPTLLIFLAPLFCRCPELVPDFQVVLLGISHSCDLLVHRARALPFIVIPIFQFFIGHLPLHLFKASSFHPLTPNICCIT